ncbi:MAG: hypothetical protein AUK47_12585 [Deltaproteobacteria bacterium CG2_30_63_29]|nr:MAG: hypothetical protein AUK47_12585 [Deltaproteobacteria bacterium CG2_30_63_29]
MCWSGEASALIAVGGLSSAYFLKRRGMPREIYLPTAYFVLMEGLQAFTYLVVGQCGHPANMAFTWLAMMHISFQPFFINMLGMEFIDPEVKTKIKSWVYVMCAVVAAGCMLRLMPAYDLLGRCELGTAMCSHSQTCAYRGEWHIGWDVLLNGFNEGWRWYVFAAFLVPILYGSWKWSLYHYVVGPLAASLTTSDVSERPAVWCLFSTMIIAMLVNTPLRKAVNVKRWPTWRFLKTPPPVPAQSA